VPRQTRAFFTETCSNPALDVANIKAISDEAHKLGLPLIVDDTFTTPHLQRPFDHGADIICESLTKWTGGHGTAIGGIVIDKGTFDWSTGKHPLFTEVPTRRVVSARAPARERAGAGGSEASLSSHAADERRKKST
jgi:O-acetylhomoserine (thiol)-lyase